MPGPYRCALLGQHIGYSLSADIFRRLFRLLDMEGIYEVIDIPPAELENKIERLRTFGGFSVTVPYKEEIVKKLDRVDPVASAIGAVNSVACDGGKLAGYNTDWQGFLYPLRERVRGNERVLVIGNGGAARAVIYALLMTYPEMRITIAGRNEQKARILIDCLAAHGETYGSRITWTELNRLERIRSDIAVNCTPVGGIATPGMSPVPKSCDLSGLKVAYDLVYVPEKTGFLAHMGEAGCETINGLPMLVFQAAASLGIWRGISLDVKELAANILTTVNGAK